ncbi:MAG TPA: long-chain-fatty-acid--CoA ligase [Anaerolineales bacterium]|nr:long-chain-fatty-acid--CoA ligase [Anaerolineales bacterium]
MRLHDFLDYRAREQGDAEFAIHGDRHITYRAAQAEIHRLANALLNCCGLQPGDRIAILSKNSIEYMLLYFAASKVGLVTIPLNYRLAPAEWSYILNDAGAKVLFAAGDYLRDVETIRGELETVLQFIAIHGADTSGWDAYQNFTANQPEIPPTCSVTPEDDLFQLYTSGTTGHPKGAILTHQAVTTHILQMGLAHNIQPGERLLLVAPVFHVAALNAGAFPCLAAGGCLYIQTDFKPDEVVRALDEEQIGMAILVPAMVQACLTAVPDVDQRRYEDLRLIHYGASPIAEATLRRAIETFKCELSQGYGMTEMSAAIAILSWADHQRALREKPGLLLAAGRPILGTEVRVVDADDNDVPTGTIGEVLARGPQMMKGYWKQPEATADALRGGWMHTGDAGILDEEGYLYIQDRVKDMVISGGENIYPRVVEEVLFKHPAVAEVAVIGVPDEQWGETIKAVLVLRPGMTATEEEIIDFCRGKLGGFERPRSVDFVDSLPRTPSGKVLKRVLREPYWAGQSRHVAGA